MPTTSGDYEWDVVALATKTGTLGTESEVTQERIIRRTDASVIDITVEEEAMITAGVLRVSDSLYADPASPGMSWIQFARYRGHTLEYAEDKYAVRARMRWSTMYVVDPTSTETVLYMLPCSTEYSGRTRNTRVFRTGWSVSPPSSSDASADIGGTAVTGGFQGKDWIVPQVSVRMRFLQDASAVPMDGAATTLGNYIGTISSATFLGFPAYSMICEGMSMSKSSNGTEYYEISFDFVYDKWFHHEQVATAAEDGNPRMTGTGPSEVKWKRLPRTATDFNNLFGSDAQLQQLTEAGWWE